MGRYPTESWDPAKESEPGVPVPRQPLARSRIVPGTPTDSRIVTPDGFDGSDPAHTSDEFRQGYRRL